MSEGFRWPRQSEVILWMCSSRGKSSSPGGLEVQGLPVDLCLDLDKHQGPNRLGQQAEQGGPRYLDQEWSFLRDRVCVCCLDPSRGKTVPSPSVKMYLTVGELGEGFAACLRRAILLRWDLLETNNSHPGERKGVWPFPDKLQALHILLLQGKYCRVGFPEGRSWEHAPTDTCFVCGLNIEAFLGPAKQKISLQAFLEVIFSVAMALILPLLLKDQVENHSCFSSSLGWFH